MKTSRTILALVAAGAVALTASLAHKNARYFDSHRLLSLLFNQPSDVITAPNGDFFITDDISDRA